MDPGAPYFQFHESEPKTIVVLINDHPSSDQILDIDFIIQQKMKFLVYNIHSFIFQVVHQKQFNEEGHISLPLLEILRLNWTNSYEENLTNMIKYMAEVAQDKT